MIKVALCHKAPYTKCRSTGSLLLMHIEERFADFRDSKTMEYTALHLVYHEFEGSILQRVLV